MITSERIVTAAVCAMILLLPFDLAIPANGWTPLFLRPLLLTLGAIALVGLVAARHTLDSSLTTAAGVAGVGMVALAAVADDRWLAGSVVVRLLLVLLAMVLASSPSLSHEAVATAVLAMAVIASAIGFAVLRNGGELWFTEDLLGRISRTGGTDRLTRPFSQANIAAMVLTPAALLLWADAFPRGIPSLSRFAGSGIAMIAVVLTLSRGGLLALGVGLVWIAAVRWRNTPRHGAISALLAGLVVSSPLWLGRWSDRLTAEPGASLRPQTRTETWTQAGEAFLSSPLTGVGPGHFGSYSLAHPIDGALPAAHTHSLYLEVLATMGMLGLVVLAPTAWVVVKRMRSRKLNAAFAPVLAILVHGLVDYPLVFTSSGTMAGLMVGVWAGRQERQ